MMLELDVGNTRVKWRCLNERGEIGDSGAWQRAAGWSGLDCIECQITGARAVSVAGETNDQLLRAAIRAKWGVEVRFAASLKEQGDLLNSYDDVSRMGADRWLAMLAVRAQTNENAVVVSCGSAVTIDLIAANGQHLGGYILPGLIMMRDALLKRTSKVRFNPEELQWRLQPGTATAEAVHNGALLAVCSSIESVISAQTPEPECYLCGGDARLIASNLNVAVALRESLVLDGLAIALPDEAQE